MKRKVQDRRKRKGDTGMLKKLMVSVDSLVRSEGGGNEETDERHSQSHIRLKSRKEERKKKRRMKKVRMKRHYQGIKDVSESTKPHDKATEPVPTTQTKPKDKTSKGVKQIKQGGVRMQESRKKALLEANVEEEREIKRLEKVLKLNKRKNKKSLPQSFVHDGLDYILEALEPAHMMDMEPDSLVMEGEEEEDEHNEDDGQSDEEEDKLQPQEEMEEEESGEDEEEFDEEEKEEHKQQVQEEEEGSAEDDDEEEQQQQHVKESTETAGKYVPPHLRDTDDCKRKAELERLKRNIKGLVNRLSEPNMPSISAQLEQLYMSHSRKDMSQSLTEILLSACVGPALMPDRLLMEHMLLVSVLHHTVGLEVGAHFLETVVRRLDESYRRGGEGKECDNLLAMVAHLYNFQVVHAGLVLDILRMLSAALGEREVELVLFLLKNVGFALRKDDPAALREVISQAQRQATTVGAKFHDQTRVRFMLDTMMALKNNDMRKIPGYNPEPVERLRKLQRTLVQQSSGGDVKLRVSLENLLAADSVGRWWIVGSSWSGAPMIGDAGDKRQQQQQDVTPAGQFSAKVLELARKQRMNTEVRRNIFCVLMTSEDYLDAFEKVLRMGLKGQQEREIIHVLLDCCLQEKAFNAFYAVLGHQLCSHDRRLQMTLQFSLWDKFKELPDLTGTGFSNLVQLVVWLLQKKTLSLSLLKVIEFGELDKSRARFLRQVLTKLLSETEPEELTLIFGRISGIANLNMLREGLKLFVSHFLLKNTQSSSDVTQKLTGRADIVTRALDAKDAKLKL